MRFRFTALILCKTAAAIAWKPLWDTGIAGFREIPNANRNPAVPLTEVGNGI